MINSAKAKGNGIFTLNGKEIWQCAEAGHQP
jgi:hypothetical protein